MAAIGPDFVIKADLAQLEARIVGRIGRMESRILRDIGRRGRWMMGIALAVAALAVGVLRYF